MTPSDHDLLQRFAAEGAQSAFAELVSRHLDLVYSVARRHLGSTSLTADVAQSVFLDLARQASRVPRDTPLVAWLHLVARLALARQRAQNLVAGELRNAIGAFLEVSGDLLPASLAQLRPHLSPPLVPEMLSRYELVHTGKLADIPPRDRSTRLIATRSVIDPARDTFVTIGSRGWATYSGNTPGTPGVPHQRKP